METYPGNAPAKAAPRRWPVWAAVAGVWSFFGILYATRLFFGLRADGMDHSYWRLLAWQLLGWGFWGAATPLVLWLGRRFPFERLAWPRALGVHLGACLLLAAAHAVSHEFFRHQLAPFDDHDSGRRFWDGVGWWLTSQFYIELLTYGAILGVGLAFSYYVRFRERETRASQLEAQLAQAQLQALKMQLHPHFLFNTLNGVAGLVRDGRNKEAVRMLAGLSDLLRHTLQSAGKQEVSLREELDLLELYLDIQQMRFPDRLRVEMRAAPETLDALVPNLILQPLVENAVRHGVAPRAASGTVGILSEREDGLLWLTVYDDGPGLRDDHPPAQGGGIGLANTRARLEQLYGARHRFAVRNREGGGVEAIVAVPFRSAGGEGRV